MSQENQITLRGYLTAEPKLYQRTPQAVPLTELRVGSTPRRLNHETGEWRELPTSYFKVKCWRRLAINAASSLHKGDQVLIRGKFYMNNWVDSEQRPRSMLEIEADTLGHDLAYGWSHYLRGTQRSGNGAAVNSGEMARQDTEAPAPDEPEGEFPPDLEGSEPDDPEEAASPTGSQGQPEAGGEGSGEADGEAGGEADGEAGGEADGEAGGEADGEAGGEADGEAGGSEPEETPDAPSEAGDASSTERELVPF